MIYISNFLEKLQDHRSPLFAILIIQFAIVIVISIAPREFLVSKMTDDAFYYYAMAQHLAAGDGITFDGIHRTNGVQLLWLFILTPLYWVFEGLWSPVRASIVLQGVLTLISTTFVYISLRDLFDWEIATVGTITFAFNPYIISMYLGGHEAAINILFLTLILYLLVVRQRKLLSLSILGVVCGFAFLARLDNAILIAVLGGALLGGKAIRSVREFAFFIISVSVLPLTYVLYNLISFGHIIPVSGKVLGTASTSVVIAYVSVCGGLALLFSFLVTRADARSNSYRIVDMKVIILIFAIAGVAHLGYYVFFNSRLAIWYLAVEVISGVLIGSFVLKVLSRTLSNWITEHSRQIVVSILIFLIIGSYGVIAAVDKADPNEDELGKLHYEQAKWLQNNTECDAIIGSGNAGMLGYFSQRHVVELNGLANSYRFVERYQGNHSKYILERRPDYLVDYQPHVEEETLRQANYTLVHNISITTQEQRPMKPMTMVNPNERRFVHEVWMANGTELNPDPDCSSI